jgi:prepilin-type N-terminal cleavage/methylation domain-containing protein
MNPQGQKGFTLVELVMAVAIMGIIAAASTTLVSTYLHAQAQGTARSELYREGMMAMERMADGVRRCTFLVIPNAHTPVRDILAFSGSINEDSDYYFGDPLFPRIDEDVGPDMNADGKNGLAGINDDGQGAADEPLATAESDDEDIAENEERLDGDDDDGDGNVDEDLSSDMNKDTKAGISAMDDDADGLVDEDDLGQEGLGDQRDDDEDGFLNEDPLNETVYTFDSGTSTLTESVPYTGDSVVLSEHVTGFQVAYSGPEAILITLGLTGGDGETVQFVEAVSPRNTLQKTGKRVR